jgi:malonyl CoA-acyl carrier protein transacylase
LPDFSEMVYSIAVNKPEISYVSTVDQKIIDTPDGIRNELIRNLPSRMSWIKTMKKLLDLGSDMIFECGPSDGLTRNARFIEGNYSSFSVIKLDKFLQAVR